MTTGQKVILGLSITATGALLGWAIYEGTKKKVGSGMGGSEDTPDAPEEKPAVTLVSEVKNPDGTTTRTWSDGTKKTYTPAQLIEDAKKAVAGRGADGWES